MSGGKGLKGFLMIQHPIQGEGGVKVGQWYKKIEAQMYADGIDPENDDGKVHFSIQAAIKMWLGILVNTTHPKSATKKKKQFLKYPTEYYSNHFYSPTRLFRANIEPD